jgi:hypothetical protein
MASRGVSVQSLGHGFNNTNYLAVGGNKRVVINLSKPQAVVAGLGMRRLFGRAPL